MSHKAVREFLCDKAKSLRDDVTFGYGRGSDFNQITNKLYPYIWLDPLNSTINYTEGQFTETYSVSMIFYGYDKADSSEKEYSLILDQTDELVQKFSRVLQEDLLTDSNSLIETFQTQNVSIDSFNKSPFIKLMADVLTGWVVTFNLTVPDQFDYCSEL
jgi:hypothetical protein